MPPIRARLSRNVSWTNRRRPWGVVVVLGLGRQVGGVRHGQGLVDELGQLDPVDPLVLAGDDALDGLLGVLDALLLGVALGLPVGGLLLDLLAVLHRRLDRLGRD